MSQNLIPLGGFTTLHCGPGDPAVDADPGDTSSHRDHDAPTIREAVLCAQVRDVLSGLGAGYGTFRRQLGDAACLTAKAAGPSIPAAILIRTPVGKNESFPPDQVETAVRRFLELAR